MSITAVITFTATGAAIGAAAGTKAIRSGETGAGTVALWSAGAVALGSFMLVQWLFWSSFEATDMRQMFLPDFLSPGRIEKILWWYAVVSGGMTGLLSAAWGWLHCRRQQA